ncbi:MAG: FAD-dependent oxidoreductase [Acidimicrobiia bacterium]
MGARIAIVGSGISGLGAAWALHRDNDITVFEADARIGGHSHTVDVATDEGVTSVDTGFIVYNEVTYPNLTRLFGELDVPTQPSDMSFSFSLDGRLEYAASIGGVLAQPSNLLRPRFVRMLRDIDRFRRTGSRLTPGPDETIGALLRRHGFGPGFMHDYLFPMTGAIWSSSREDIAGFPAASILAFLGNHGLIEVVGRPTWRTVTGGSRNYVSRLVAGFRDRIRTNTPVTGVSRGAGGVTVRSDGRAETFDELVLACHSDQALQVLGTDATDSERLLLGAIRYQPNVAVLHGDPAAMPTRRGVWSAWNARARTEDIGPRPASVTYWMNRLQSLEGQSLFVTLNPIEELNRVHARLRYSHPSFDRKAIDAQVGITAIQGRHNTWFAGAYLGYGFHEDGLQSGLNVAAALGSPSPWHGSFTPASSATMARARP